MHLTIDALAIDHYQLLYIVKVECNIENLCSCYDLMIDKGYKFSDINKLLRENNFTLRYKVRMKFRKSFEYIYGSN